MAKSFTVPCPSCEADVLVKNEGMIGKKIDCTKCKYRFKVPDPNAGDADDTPTAEAPILKKKKKGNPKVMIGVGVSIAALVLLGVVCFLMFSGDEPKPQPKPPVVQRTAPQPDVTPKVDGDPMTPKVEGEPMTPMVEGDPGIPLIAPPPPMTNQGNPMPMVPKVEVAVAVAVASGQLKDPTNLLPGDTKAVLQLNMPRLQNTPIYSAFFDRQTLDFFRSSMQFDATDISMVVLALVGAERQPFTVIRTKSPVQSLNALSDRMDFMQGKLSPIKQRPYAILKTNPFVTAISRALSTEALLGQAGIPITDEDKKRWQEKPLALCIYDSQTVLIGDVDWMERFLEDLGENGYPPFLSELTSAAAPPAPAPMAGGAEGAVPMNPMGPPMGAPMPMNSSKPPGAPTGPPMGGGMQIPMGPGGMQIPMGPPMAGGTGPAPKAAPKLYTSIPTYRSIKPELKRMLNLMDEDDKNPAAILYADMLDKRLFTRDYQSVYAQIGMILGAIVEHTQIVGLSIANLQKEKFTAQLAFEFVSAEDAKATANERLDGLFKLLAALLSKPLGTTIEVKNTAGGQGGNGPGDMGPMGPGGSRSGPPGTATQGGFVQDGQENLTPMGPMGPMGTRPGGAANASRIELGVRDTLVTVDAEINWSADAYAKLIQPGITGATAQLKGRMAVLSGATKQHDLATPLKKLIDEKQMVPPTSFARNANIERYGLPYQPDHRVSFMADLLPYLGRGGLRQSIEEKKLPWYAKEHEAAGMTWVSEFLVPYYPQTSWRATHPLTEGKSYGGTNYVALSGLGLDSARYDPADPAYAKKVGMTGYDWGSKPAEVTDGLSNTIYMIQVPPTHARPWIAGGGATVQGVDDTLANPIEDFVHTAPGNKRGTFVLMGDGSVRFVPETINSNVFKAMATRAGGESVDLDKEAPLVGGPKKTEVELKGSAGGNPFRPKAPTTKKDESPKKDAATEADLDKLQGKWKATKAYVGRESKIMPTELLTLMQFQIVGNRLIATGNGKEISTAEFTLDATKTPKTMVTKTTNVAIPLPELKVGDEEYAVYELVGDKLMIRNTPKGSKEFPKDTKMPETGSKDDYLELERVKD